MRYADCPPSLVVAPFTLAQARRVGVSPTALQSAPWRQVFRGVWAHEAVPETREMRLAAARLVLPTHAVLCGQTAAWIHGADVRRVDDLDVHVSFAKGARIRRRPGLVVTQETLALNDIADIEGTSVTTAVRTAFDSLRLLRGSERIVVADALTHLGRTGVAELRQYFGRHRRLRNLRLGERLLDEVEPLSESPMESRLRLSLTAQGLPRPVAQFSVFDTGGRFLARLDLAYPELKVAIEYDGAWHWARRREDDRRRDLLRALGWVVLVYSSDDVYGNPERIANEVAAARRQQAAKLAG